MATNLNNERVYSNDRSAEDDGTMLKRLGTDPTLWAREFMRRVQFTNSANMNDMAREDFIDTLRAWFANAIEQARTEGAKYERERYKERVNALFNKFSNSPNTVNRSFVLPPIPDGYKLSIIGDAVIMEPITIVERMESQGFVPNIVGVPNEGG